MDSILSELNATFPARKQQIAQLYNLFGQKNDLLVDAVYIFGCTSTGKTSLVRGLLEKVHVKHCIVNLVECYSTKVFLEKILNILAGHSIDPSNPCPYAKCENAMDFIEHLKKFSCSTGLDSVVFVLDKAENLRSMDHNLLPIFMSLRKLTGIEISTILISELPFEKFYGYAHYDPIKVFFPQYTKDELMEILARDYPYFKEVLAKDFPSVDFLSVDFFRAYLNVFLSVFYRTCRDLSELRHNARLNFVPYCDPIFQKNCNPNDSMALWRFIAPTLKSCLEVLYLRIANTTDTIRDDKQPLNLMSSKENLAQTLELPFYAKYLLIAAYLASYNSPKDDKRLFVKYHGKKRKSKRDMSQKNKVSEQLNTQLGPKAFNLDRLIAIFYSILDEKVGLTHNLLVQVTTLVELQLLLLVSENAGIDVYKYKCNVGYDFIENVSRMVGFNIRKYLITDFN
ncbi:origin recognition complex subunit 5 [Agrilus planipennis]|uniref:Origin recognition complex subunit 5 n=1 Tax=Agrilus planipennis TaxID=224129 RepID=A0A1W4WE71_AGRPL|nr:origin recognition complex subunit 5 [Agrilus planipennis]XP_018318413.1 origin recognition complex subunit 5 [Agrilus planipennis]XP_018318414.1 origin recognition complex subunit 5 [Agrilus planipennis]